VMPLEPRLRDFRKGRVRAGSLDLRAIAALPPYVFRLARRLNDLRPDIVHTNSLKSALYGGLAGRLVGVRVVWHVRDRISADYLPLSAVALVRLAARLLPKAVIANSYATLATVPGARRGSVVYNSVESRPPSTARESGGELTIGIVGRLAPWKGQRIFLEAFAAAFRGEPVRGRIVGTSFFGEEEYERALRERARDLGIARQVDFRGFRAEVWSELSELAVLVHSSVTPEPWGQVVLEGMAAGLAVVAADAGGPAELITNGVDGLLVQPGDVGALTRALVRLREDPILRSNLGKAAWLRSRDFTPERTARGVMAVYEQMLA
jgi:glycosyltransferase involved in cell wall biosynthesis